MKLNQLKSLLVVFILTISACKSYKIEDFDRYKTVKTSSSEVSGVKYAKKSVVFVPFEENGEYAQKNAIGKAMSSFIENELNTQKYASVNDRKLVTKVQEEIALREMSGAKTSSEGPQVADYAVSGSVSYASFDVISSIDWIASLANKTLVSKLATSVSVEGTVKITDLSNMSTVAEINCQEKSKRILPTGMTTPPQNDGIALKNAVLRCVDKVVPKVLDKIKPYGYIVEKRVQEEKAIFKIDIGGDSGVKTGQKIIVKRNGEDGKQKSVPVDSAYVADLVEENYAWIIIKDSKDAAKIKIGDVAYVDMKYQSKAASLLQEELIGL